MCKEIFRICVNKTIDEARYMKFEKVIVENIGPNPLPPRLFPV